MHQLPLSFAIQRGPAKEAHSCVTCTLHGYWQAAECGFCRKERRRSAKRRYWLANGMDRNGRPKKKKLTNSPRGIMVLGLDENQGVPR